MAWPEPLYFAVADTMAAIHASAPQVRHLVPRVERFELPFVTPLTEILGALEGGEAFPALDDSQLAAL